MTRKPKYKYYENLSRLLSADYDIASANTWAKQLTDAQNKEEREAERQKLRAEIWAEWVKYDLDKNRKK